MRAAGDRGRPPIGAIEHGDVDPPPIGFSRMLPRSEFSLWIPRSPGHMVMATGFCSRTTVCFNSREVAMDGRAFDNLTRAVGGGSSRRAFGRFLGAVAAGGLFLPGYGAAEAKNKKKKKNAKNKKNQKKKNECPGGCSGGLYCCNGACVDLLSNNSHCLECGRACLTGQFCSGGTCSPCESPSALCMIAGQQRCINLQTDNNNCGSCGNVCPKDPAIPRRDFVCQGGQCVCNGTICPNGSCCPSDFNVCVDNGAACCPTNHTPCKGRCCEPGLKCGGTCESTCCP